MASKGCQWLPKVGTSTVPVSPSPSVGLMVMMIRRTMTEVVIINCPLLPTRTQLVYVINSLVNTLKGRVAVFLPPHPLSGGRGRDVGGGAGLTPKGVLSLPLPLQTMPWDPSRVRALPPGGLKPPMFSFSYAQKPHGSKAPLSHSIIATAHHDRAGSSAWPLAWLPVLAAAVASGRGDRKQALSARRQSACQALN